MPCFHPLKGFKSRYNNGIAFNPRDGYEYRPMTVPCGQCVGCRLERSRQWAIRCTHEASLYDDNCFITLTYDNEHLPADRSLNLKHFQDFMKRLRKHAGAGVRFYHCGEYGSKYGRPHYHAIIFNFDFHDKYPWQETKHKHVIYRSPTLERLWTFGYSSIGGVTFQSTAYVARYIMKKHTGKDADDYYKYIDKDGVVHARKPEYTTMSRRPGIGKGWLDSFQSDVYPHDYVVINGKKVRPPRYYDQQFEITDPDEAQLVKRQRRKSLTQHADNNTRERLDVRERLQLARLDQLKREIDDET